MSQEFEIKGVHCKSCKMLITDVLEDEGVKILKFDENLDAQNAKIKIESKLSPEQIMEFIRSAGEYEVVQK